LVHKWLAGEVDEDGTEIKLDESEQQTADFLQERAQSQISRIFGDEPTLEVNERRLWLTVNGQKLASGRFDRCVYTPTVALVQDFKTGWREPVEAEQNAQMKMLAVLVALHLPSMLREVIVQIVSGPYGVTEARYDLAALAKAYNEILATLRAIQDPMAPLSPSPEACRYCPAINICQAVKNLIVPVAKTQVSALPDGARGAKLLDEVELLQEHLDSIREHYAQRLTADPAYDLPGWARIPNAPRREIVDVETAKRRLAEFLDPGELNAAIDLKIGQVEKLFGKKVGLKGKDLREKFNAIMEGVVVEKMPNPSLKRVSKRALVEITLP
jgi:hypothetical protein